jgi:hypothetical protein
MELPNCAAAGCGSHIAHSNIAACNARQVCPENPQLVMTVHFDRNRGYFKPLADLSPTMACVTRRRIGAEECRKHWIF